MTRRQYLELAAHTSGDFFTTFKEPVAIAAAHDERQQFVSFIRELDGADLASQSPLPFRRVLGSIEHRRLLIAFNQQWGNGTVAVQRERLLLPRSRRFTNTQWMTRHHMICSDHCFSVAASIVSSNFASMGML